MGHNLCFKKEVFCLDFEIFEETLLHLKACVHPEIWVLRGRKRYDCWI